MDESVRTLAEALNNAPHVGRFKSTQRLASALGLDAYRDFSRIDTTSTETVSPPATDIWGEIFKADNTRDNVLFYGMRKTPKRLLRRPTPALTLIGFPGEYNRFREGRAYSVDEREGRGTAHFAIDIMLDKKRAKNIQSILDSDSSLLNEALAMTEWGYHGVRFNPYESFMIGLSPVSMEDIKSAISGGERLLLRDYPGFRTSQI